MDLNYLLHRQQVSLMKAAAAVCREARYSHALMAQGYARRINERVHGLRDSDTLLMDEALHPAGLAAV
ncbi:hypothetical protein [uncultured Sphingomonas sp.]|uniref:hypothetical protein n=1 Tax=uncultured Sphingomonas sp. TaxID=158754 RepID=UPI00258A531B|nr:hypothetical protein [uncultured Sphingomonas sp.]